MAGPRGNGPTVTPPDPSRDGGDAVTIERLSRVERRVYAQAAALSAVPASEPLPRSVLALLATPTHELDGIEVPPHLLPSVAALLGRVAAMADDLALRQRSLAGRIATVRAARRSGPAPSLLDRAG